jgi:hypothetical protein
MDKNSLLSQTVSDFYNGFENITSSGWYIFHSQSWAIFKIDSSIDKGGFWYLWITRQTWLYCNSGSEFPDLDYLTWKSFIPHEEIGEDIFNNFWDILTQTVSSWSTTYKVDTLNHQVLEDDVVIIWWRVFWHEFSNNENWLNTRLNNPTAISLAEWWFFLSDTLNNRILYYKDNNVYLILDQNDGLNEPTWLAYDNTKNILYIANSWKWEILKFSAEVLLTNPQLDITFSPINDINSISRINLEFPEFSWNLDPVILWDVTFNNINNWVGYIQIIWNTIEYYFSDFSNISEPITNWFIPWCTPSDIYSLNWTTPEREIISCSDTNTGTLQIHTWDIYNNLNNGNIHGITIQNISPIFPSWINHLVNIELFNDATSRYTDTFGYFTQWDWIVNNLEFTTLSTLITWLNYPSWLSISWNNLLINDFATREQYSYDLDNISSFSTSSLNNFSGNNLENIPYTENLDVLLQNPIASIDLNYNNTDKFLSVHAKYYQYLNCYNPEEQVQKSFILQKNID